MVEEASIISEQDFRNLLKAFNIFLEKNVFDMFYNDDGSIKIREFIEFYS